MIEHKPRRSLEGKQEDLEETDLLCFTFFELFRL